MRAICPGPSATGLYDAADQDLSRLPQGMRFLLVTPAEVVGAALTGLGRKRTVIVGRGNKLIVQAGRIFRGA